MENLDKDVKENMFDNFNGASQLSDQRLRLSPSQLKRLWQIRLDMAMSHCIFSVMLNNR